MANPADRRGAPLDYNASTTEALGRWDYVIAFPNPPTHVIEELMRREVEYLKMHLQLDPAELRRALFNGIPEYGIAPFPTRDVK
ncbi:hypothetical protein PRIC2_002578 [Phytophthora ramorum]